MKKKAGSSVRGVIEGTCKHLVKTRFAATGPRWRRRNIHKTLALCLAAFNSGWDEYGQIPRPA